MRSVKRVFKLCCERKCERIFKRRRRVALLNLAVIPAGPPTPPAESTSATVKSRGTSYYRPSMEMILKLLKIKIDYFASEDQWNCFDHLVRNLGRDGLLGKDTNQELVRSESTMLQHAQTKELIICTQLHGSKRLSSIIASISHLPSPRRSTSHTSKSSWQY